MKMTLPPSTLKDTTPPDENYEYFQRWTEQPLRPAAAGFDPVNAWRLAELSLLAYADASFIEQRSQALKHSGYSVRLFQVGNTQYLLVHNSQAIVIAFRGTEVDNFWGSVCDWVTDLKIKLKEEKHGGRIHRGFEDALDLVWEQITRQVSELRAGDPNKSVWITGHSLGAAVATLAASRAMVERHFEVTGLYTFGSPLVGDRSFKDRFMATDLRNRTCRFRNHNDVVTRVPPFPEYDHVGSLKFIDNSGHLHHLEDESEIGSSSLVAALADVLAFARLCSGGLHKPITIPGFISDHAPTYYARHLFNNLPGTS